MRQKYQRSLNRLKSNTLEMGETSLSMLKDAVNSVNSSDKDLAKKTIKRDELVDAYEMSIDRCVSALITLQQPMAHDMRLVTSCLTMSIDIERLSDLASNIAWVTIELENESEEIKILIEYIKKMGDVAEKMFNDAIRAFETDDADLAKNAAALDENLDKLFFDAEKFYIEHMSEYPNIISDASHLLFVLRYLERIGDHVCNICQSIIYTVTGERIRLN